MARMRLKSRSAARGKSSALIFANALLRMVGKRRRRAASLIDCMFTTHTDEKADVILSLDAFEHFDDPAEILRIMRRLLKDDGCMIAAFGPTWYHPLGRSSVFAVSVGALDFYREVVDSLALGFQD